MTPVKLASRRFAESVMIRATIALNRPSMTVSNVMHLYIRSVLRVLLVVWLPVVSATSSLRKRHAVLANHPAVTALAPKVTAHCAILSPIGQFFIKTNALLNAQLVTQMLMASAWNVNHPVVNVTVRQTSVSNVMARMLICTCLISLVGLSAQLVPHLTKQIVFAWLVLALVAPFAN